jgi:hypothetical protein
MKTTIEKIIGADSALVDKRVRVSPYYLQYLQEQGKKTQGEMVWPQV